MGYIKRPLESRIFKALIKRNVIIIVFIIFLFLLLVAFYFRLVQGPYDRTSMILGLLAALLLVSHIFWKHIKLFLTLRGCRANLEKIETKDLEPIEKDRAFSAFMVFYIDLGEQLKEITPQFIRLPISDYIIDKMNQDIDVFFSSSSMRFLKTRSPGDSTKYLLSPTETKEFIESLGRVLYLRENIPYGGGMSPLWSSTSILELWSYIQDWDNKLSARDESFINDVRNGIERFYSVSKATKERVSDRRYSVMLVILGAALTILGAFIIHYLF